MKRLVVFFALMFAMSGCATMEQNLQDSNSLLLSAKEVREIFQGNTVISTTGESFYWDADGTVKGKGSYGSVIKGKWNITADGRLCVSNWDSANVPAGCYKVYFDNTIHQHRMIDMNGELKHTLTNSVVGNPNNF